VGTTVRGSPTATTVMTSDPATSNSTASSSHPSNSMANLLLLSRVIDQLLLPVQVLLCELIVISKEKFRYFLLSLFKYEFVCSLLETV
jgi:hypothetical protein